MVKEITAKEVISSYEMIKNLIRSSTIYADPQINDLDRYFDQQLLKEIKHG